MSEPKIADTNFSTGAVRSADVSHLDFASAPLLGFLAMLRVAGGGGTKYGRFNYMHGMPIHETINHIAVHLIRYCLGDRSEPHLAKVAWGALVAEQTAVLHPELCEPHMLGLGATLTPAILAELDRGKPERDAKRQAGEFEALFNWTLGEMPEVQAILKARCPSVELERDVFGTPRCAAGDTVKTAWGDIPVTLEPGAVPGKVVYVDPEGSHPVDHDFRSRDKVDPSFGPGSTNAKVYGTPTRTTTDHGNPDPRPGETWVEYEDGTRAYFIKGRGKVEVDDEGCIVLPPERDGAGTMGRQVYVTINGSTKLVPADVVYDNVKCAYGRDDTVHYSAILIVSQAEDEYALMSPQLRHQHTLVVSRALWDSLPDSSPQVIEPMPAARKPFDCQGKRNGRWGECPSCVPAPPGKPYTRTCPLLESGPVTKLLGNPMGARFGEGHMGGCPTLP